MYAQCLTQPSIPLGTGGIQMMTHTEVTTYRLHKQKDTVQCKNKCAER